MKKIKEKLKYDKKAITLISLVITIVVLLILAGISITMLTNENGILTQAKNAKENTEIAEEKEELELLYTNILLYFNTNKEIDVNIPIKFKEELDKKGKYDTIILGDSFVVINKLTNAVYELNGEKIEYKGKKQIFINSEPIMMSRDETKAFWKEEIRNRITGIETKPYIIIPDNVFKDEIWDISYAQDKSVMAWIENRKGNEYILVIGSNGKTKIRSGRGLFSKFLNVTTIDISALDFTTTSSFSYMFSSCENLESVQLKGIDTSQIQDMSYMFNCCKKIKSIDLSSWNTEKLVIMQAMFYNCSNLTDININSLNTSKVINMHTTFAYCSKLEKINLSKLDVSNVEMFDMTFRGCTNLKNLNIDGWNVSKAKSLQGMFMTCSSLEKINLKNFNTKNVTRYGRYVLWMQST